MWKDYSVSYIKKNKAASVSIMVAAFIATLFISMLSSLFYNMWIDDTRRLLEKEGNWQARFAMEMSEQDIQYIQNYANVKDVVISGSRTEVYFEDLSSIYTDMPQIANMVNVEEKDIEYHNKLLIREFIFLPEEGPPLLWLFYICVFTLVCISLILIIKNAFRFSMDARVHQLGILKSIGATPKQLRSVLLQEALVLSVIPILLGTISGIGLCMCFVRYANKMSAKIQISGAVFGYHYLLFIITIVCSFLTVFLSAWFPARQLSKISPLQAIKREYEKPARRMKRFYLTSAVFGVEGELSRKSLYARRKAYRTASICLTISFLVVTMFLNFMTISEISTGHTYFEKFKDSWDIMIEVKNLDTIDNDLLHRLREIDGVDTCTGYQKNKGYTVVDRSDMSDEVNALGGYDILNRSSISLKEDAYLVETPMIVLDYESYIDYGRSIGAKDMEADVCSVILLNSIWDSENSGFRSAEYIPFLTQNVGQELVMYSDIQAVNELEKVVVAAYAEKAPNLREEYSDYGLVQVMSQNTYLKLTKKLPAIDENVYIKIGAISDGNIERIESRCTSVLGDAYEYTIENRPEKETTNAEIYDAYKKIMTALCGLLACIGIANVFANTLGFIYQRKREFARYQSVGLTPTGVSKIFCVEAFIIGVKPILISIPFNLIFIVFAVNASGMNMSEFIPQMPIVPILAFSFVVLLAVGISYFIGGKQIKYDNIVDTLKNDALF